MLIGSIEGLVHVRRTHVVQFCTRFGQLGEPKLNISRNGVFNLQITARLWLDVYFWWKRGHVAKRYWKTEPGRL